MDVFPNSPFPQFFDVAKNFPVLCGRLVCEVFLEKAFLKNEDSRLRQKGMTQGQFGRQKKS